MHSGKDAFRELSSFNKLLYLGYGNCTQAKALKEKGLMHKKGYSSRSHSVLETLEGVGSQSVPLCADWYASKASNINDVGQMKKDCN